MKPTRLASAILLAAVLSSCGLRSSTTVSPSAGAVPAAGLLPHTDPARLLVTEKDITNRKYHALGDIQVTVSKYTIFDDDPTPARVDEALRVKAAEMGADAVILVRYGALGIGVWSWGTLDGNGRAVAYDR